MIMIIIEIVIELVILVVIVVVVLGAPAGLAPRPQRAHQRPTVIIIISSISLIIIIRMF